MRHKPTLTSLSLLCLMLFLGALCLPAMAHGGDDGIPTPSEEGALIKFTDNKGQWNDKILHKLRFRYGGLFLEKDRLTYNFIDGRAWNEIWEHHHGAAGKDTVAVNGHAFYVKFNNANPSVQTKGSETYPFYENYYLGQDPSKWASHVDVHNRVTYQELYDEIDLTIYGKGDNLKYDYIIRPGGDPTNISFTFEGLEDVFIRNGRLHYRTSVTSTFEEQPYAYQVINGVEVNVPVAFKLEGKTVTFDLLQGYDPNYELVIDPDLIFSTFTGSFADNFGYTATFDNTGHFYAGGIARAAGYPTTVGAFQATYGGGILVGQFDLGFDSDMGITKFTPDGASLVFSTFVGGVQNEQPHSLVVTNNDELLIYGRSNSNNYPVSGNAYDNTYNGNMDIVVTKFTPDGSNLLGSTFVGGVADDATNITPSPQVSSTLKYNYADDARGEIIIDDQDNVYVASCTRSSDFPIVGNVFQNSLSGSQDGCIVKLNPDLSSIIWSSYIGGNDNDAAYSLVLDPQGQIYTCGGTNSTNFPVTNGTITPSPQGGRADGFISHIASDGSSLISSTYYGTPQYDQTYFVQLDGSTNVYVVGQTAGTINVTPGVYSNANSGQFITSLTPDLASINFSTIFGKGDGDPDISPTAFLVDQCRNIYVAGWGGNTNFDIENMSGLPVTNDAIRPTTVDGSDFYLFVLSRDAQSLVYGSYFGGNQSAEHVDGGTSRFDKNGVIYEAVCAGCGGNSDFPYTPGAWSATNNSNNPQSNCNLGAFKFEFQLIGVEVDVEANPATVGCVPLTVDFDPNALNAKDFFWDFGNGNTSTLEKPTYTYTDTGTYLVTLIGVDSTSCDVLKFADTSYITIIVRDDSVSAGFSEVIISNCDSFIVQFTDNSTGIGPGLVRAWDFGDGNTSSALNPRHEYTNPGTYEVRLVVSDPNSCNGLDTLMRPVNFSPLIDAGIQLPVDNGCAPFTADFTNTSDGGVTYAWDFGNGDSSTDENPSYEYTDTGTFTVTLIISDPNSCNLTDTATTTVTVTDNSVVAAFAQNILSSGCDSLVAAYDNQSINATDFFWDFGDGTTSTEENPGHTFTQPDTFTVTLIASNPNACRSPDTAFATVIVAPDVLASFLPDNGCTPHTATLQNTSSNAVSYLWEFQDGSTSTDEDFTVLDLDVGTYNVTLTASNPNTCNVTDVATGTINVSDLPGVFFTIDSSEYPIFFPVQFTNQSTGATTYFWDFGDGNTSIGINPTHVYEEVGEYEVCLTGSSGPGCDSTYCDVLRTVFRGLIDVPTAFTPNGDGMNDVLYLEGFGVAYLEFKIYNRWGELVFESNDLSIGWDGRYKGAEQEQEVYAYTLEAVFEDGSKSDLRKGNITLLR